MVSCNFTFKINFVTPNSSLITFKPSSHTRIFHCSISTNLVAALGWPNQLTHQSSSKRKKMEHFPDKDTSVDRISNLPDSLLCHILSFLPTNEAVVTTILSSRWKPLWTLIPKLDLEDNSISDHTVYSVLAQHAAPVLQNFTLSWRSPCRTSHLNK